MARDIRGIIFVGTLVLIAAIILAIPQIQFSILNFDFDRGNNDSFLGLNLGLDLQGGTHLVYDIVDEDDQDLSTEDIEVIRSIVERRVNEFGVSEPTVQLIGNPPDRILIQIPGQSESSLTIAFEDGSVTAEDVENFFSQELSKENAQVSENEDGSMIVRFDDFDGSESEDWRTLAEQQFPTTIRATFEYEVIEPPAEEETDQEDGAQSGDEAQQDQEGPVAPTPENSDQEDTAESTPEASDQDDEAQSEDDAQQDQEDSAEPTAEVSDQEETDQQDDQEAEEEAPTRIAPTTEQVQAAFEAAGFTDVTVGDGTDTILFTTGEAGGFRQLDAIVFEAEFQGRFNERSFDDQGNIVPSDLENLRRGLVQIGNLASLRTTDNITQWTLAGGVQEAKALIGSTAQLEFRERMCGPILPPVGQEDEWPPDGLSDTEWLLLRCSDPQYFSEQATNISASDLVDAFPSIEGTPPEPVVTIVFNEAGRDAFFEVTGRVARNRDILAIYLDNAELVAPTVNTATGEGIPDGRAIISGGDFTPERVRTLAIQLRSGALPAELQLSEERNVDAILGADSLRRSMIAGAIGLVMLIIFMIAYYKIPGIVASISLIAYTIMLLGIFKLVPVTLTLSGAAAVILSLGFAVDANILIAERTKEELRAGRDLLAALNSGFNRAWPSIRDGNISTIITAGVLFWFGDRFSTSIMQGFALTLGIGVLLSMFTAFFASRLMLRLIARTAANNKSALFLPVTHQTAEKTMPGGNA